MTVAGRRWKPYSVRPRLEDAVNRKEYGKSRRFIDRAAAGGARIFFPTSECERTNAQ